MSFSDGSSYLTPLGRSLIGGLAGIGSISPAKATAVTGDAITAFVGPALGVMGGRSLAAVLARFATVVGLVETEPRRLRELHLARSLTVGRDVRVARADGTSLEGRAVDIDEAGRIVVRASGVDEVLSAGDVTHLR